MQQNWDDIRVFLAVARHETLSAAARSLRIDPATVGRRVTRLEERAGVVLFTRSPVGYVLTGSGDQFLRHALSMEGAMADLVRDLQGREGTLSGQIRIGAPDGCANFVLPKVCADISRANPDLDIQIVSMPRVVNLTKREADMAIAVSPPNSARLSVQKITEYKLHLAASEKYLKKFGAPQTLLDLKTHKIIGYIADMIFDKELDYQNYLRQDRVVLGSNSVSVQYHWLRAGAGIGIAHDFALPSSGSLKRIIPDQLSLSRNFYLLRYKEDHRLERMNRLAEALVAGLRAEISRLEALA